MLHTNSRGEEGIFYKVPGRMGVYTLKKDISDVGKELSEEGSDDSSDNLSDSRSSENNSGAVSPEGRRGRWMRRVPSKLQSQPSSPQPRCSSPPVPPSKLISPSQKHSKKALKQALKQQQQRNQRRQGGMPTVSSPRLLLKTIKDMTDISTKTADCCHPVVPRKVPQRSSRLSAGQIKRTKCKIDVETPDSILVNTNLRAIINKHTFTVLPADCQQKLLKLLPDVDRQACLDGLLKITSSALNNEFFTSAAQSWKERLSEGEFTPELQLRMRQEIEKEKKIEHWKEAFFESYYGENSGLNYEESKELTKADLHQKSDGPQSLPRQTTPVAQKPENTKCTKDRRQIDDAAKDMKSTQISQDSPRAQAGPKDSVSTMEPMRTRRSQQAEDRKLNTSAHSEPTPAVIRPEVEKQTEQGSACTPPVEEHKEETEERKIELPESPVKTNPPLQGGSESKDDQLVSTVKSEESEEVTSEPSGPSEPLKRKSLSETEGELTPEKRSRLSSVSSVSSVSSASPSASSISSPATPSPTSQRVPPLKIPVSRILPVPVSPNQVSPRTPLPSPLSSPGRTGARTLADIKAKAQLARAQRAAAAAILASKGAVPGPGPGGGSNEQRQPSPSLTLSPTSPQASARIPATSSNSSQSSTPSPRPLDSFDQFSPNHAQISCSSKTVDKHKGPAANNVSTGSSVIQRSPSASTQSSSMHAVKELDIPTGAAKPISRTSSCIPANNPLVTQLLQGKEVPLEQILPKPLSKVEVKMSSLPTCSQLRPSYTVQHRTDKQVSQQFNAAGRVGVISEQTKHHRELPDKETQEQILQALMQRKIQQSQPYGGVGSQPPQYKVQHVAHAEQIQDQCRTSVGFLTRKRTPRPAMTGHYLLNVSTYGRGPESKRLHLSVLPNKSVSSLKRESTDGEEAPKEEAAATNVFLPVSGVKTEQQGYSITKSDDPTNLSSIKAEPGTEEHAAGGNNGTGAKAKDTSPLPQSHRMHLELRNSNQGKSEPYLPHVDPCHQHPPAFQSQRTLDNQEPVVASCYGGTINMPVPQTLNHNTAGASPSTSSTDADGGGIHGSVMSFSVTVTTIPAGHSLDHGSPGEPSPEQSFIEGSSMDDVQSKCYCRLKAMIMCKGCGAFCHDDCIGPSKLCVSCLVVR
ncbi:putative Polycomb group protein ASXL2 isoform X2 [Cololabis saira]|nr:putative Polycomb group protein ASXL2 isoform X2 [Cololabis saira]XP_061600403.1 putative Polycomb group protein ASXL2 isoform X2 [Cololabis saira]